MSMAARHQARFVRLVGGRGLAGDGTMVSVKRVFRGGLQQACPVGTTPAVPLTDRKLSIAGWFDPRSFKHQNRGAFRGAGTMPNARRHCETLFRQQRDGTILKINDESPIHHIKEFVFMVMMMPVELALHYPDAHNTIIDLR